ncbi:aldehyde dehydrogenase family protein [Arthrobacter sp. I2-34]|uniref:Aldehyde dehydrogenase family protein n=1 Tax=Arthrobacter hankyongi TaxID=2904801 RepID=A0ABS9L8S6_9MICC|nr:aldehyde dehydrogenase family protein [Arthrobacter hankyongi]MCG2623067.1 aldehyde dehydrogenase family protein [Arthrobacter hankyongi]
MHMLVDGQWVAASNGATIDVVNPATGEIIGTVPEASEADVDRAVEAAVRAQRVWEQTSALARAAVMHEFAAKVRANQRELAELLTREGGSSLAENMDEIRWVAEATEYYAEMGRNIGGRVVPSQEPTLTNLVLKRPVGVVAAIAPWNYPALLLSWKLAPALAAGNAVVIKPPAETPLTVLRLIEMLNTPAGVVQVVTGGIPVGKHLAEHPQTDMVAFTGSLSAGQAIISSTAQQVKRLSLELSGQDPMIVCDDVDIDDAVEAVLWAGFTNAGQVCTSSERIYVMRNIYDEFSRKLARRADELIVGDPMDTSTDVGALGTPAQLEKTRTYVETARALGATVLAGGQAAEGVGTFYRPTVLEGLSHEQLTELGEIFGPIVPLVPVDSFDEALTVANDSQFGLGANVLTTNMERAWRAAKELRFGQVWINNPLVDNDAGPFGGQRRSGLGRELGEEGLQAFMETSHVSFDYQLERKYWWYPYSRYSETMGLTDGRSSGFLGGHAGAVAVPAAAGSVEA